jgi:hypothetical protein
MAIEMGVPQAWNENATLQIVDAGEFQPDNATSQLNTKYGSNLYERVRVTVDG